MRVPKSKESQTHRAAALRVLVLVLPLSSVFAQSALQVNTIYECSNAEGFKLLSCSGAGDAAQCDIQTYQRGQPVLRLKTPQKQIAGMLLPRCHVQTPAEAKSHTYSDQLSPLLGGPENASTGAQANSQTGAGGFKVGDNVRAMIAGAWTDARITQVRGNTYQIHSVNGFDIARSYPAEIRRSGKLTAEDHAMGQYDLHDKVEVQVNGKWMQGDVVGEDTNAGQYTIQVAGGTVTTSPQSLRMSTAPPPAKRAAMQVPKPGLASCSPKFEGRWNLSAGAAGMQLIFRSGKVSVSEGLGGEKEFECYVAGDKILLYEPGSFTAFDYPISINNDGTLETPIGEVKKKGN